MQTLLMSLAALLALAACGQTRTAPEEATMPANAAEATAQDTCGASAFRDLIGAPAADIDQSALPAGARIITPTTMVTQDFVPARLNIITDTDGIVSSLSCF